MAKQNKPAIRFKEFTDAWEQRKLGEVVKEVTRNDPTSEAPIMMITANNGFIEQSERYAFDNAGESLKKYILLQKGELAYNHGASKLRPFGSCFALTTAESARIPFVYHCFSAENQNAEFLSIELNGSEVESQLRKIVSSGARMDGLLNISFDEYSTVTVLLPDIKEQEHIADFFRNLDHLITLHQRKYDKLQVLKKAMLEKMFPKNGSSVPEIRFKGFTDAWEQRKLSEIAGKVTEKNTGLQYVETLTNSAEFGIISQRDFFDHDISKLGSLDGYYIVRNEDFVYNPRISTSAPVGPINRNKLGRTGVMSPLYTVFRPHDIDTTYLEHFFKCGYWYSFMNFNGDSGARSDRFSIKDDVFFQMPIPVPHIEEQRKIGLFLTQLDHLITLHQRKPYSHIQRRCNMLNEAQSTDKFCEYYAKWITVYKKGAIRQVTMDKYLMTQKWLEKLIPDLNICDLNRIAYQQLLNDYAEYHERQTTMDFHHQLKGAVLDAVDEGLIDRDPTRKAIIKGKAPSAKKIKYLNQFELHTLLASLELKDEVNWDYFILLVAKTGMRFSEALALTPKDFDFYHQTLSISKTWDYKGAGGFQPTKNKSSVRKIQIDWQSVIRFSELVKGLPEDQPIFVDGKVYNSTVNDVLSRHCERCNIPVISIHGLRHTHASLLLFTGVSIASVARRLGHSSMTTTQKTYLHIIQELENKDIDLVMRSLSGLN